MLHTHLLLCLLLLLSTSTIAQTMTTKTIAESSALQSADNTITFTLRPSAAVGAGHTITITGLTGTQTATASALSLGGDGANKFTSSTGDWNKDTGKLILTCASEIPSGSDTVITVALINKATAQTAVTPTVAVAGDTVTIAASAMSTTVLGAATANTMTTKTIAESTTIQGVDNTMSFTLRPSVALASGQVITITGLTGTQTATASALSLGGAGASKFTSSTGNWNKDSGVLILTAASEIPSGSDTAITVVLRNKATAQTAVTPTVAVGTGRVAIASSSMSTSVLGAATTQQYTTKTISESSAVQDAANTLTITIRPNVALSANDVIEILGLTGSQTATTSSLALLGAQKNLFSGATGNWDKDAGRLRLTVASGASVPNSQNTVVTITLNNKAAAQSGKNPTISTSGSATISSSSMSGTVMAATTARPTVGSVAPNRLYKSSATTITVSAGAGTCKLGCFHFFVVVFSVFCCSVLK